MSGTRAEIKGELFRHEQHSTFFGLNCQRTPGAHARAPGQRGEGLAAAGCSPGSAELGHSGG